MAQPELLSLVLPLRLETAPEGRDLPRWWGRAAHALFLKAVGEQDPALARRLHARLPQGAAIWAEAIDDERGELRLLAPRHLKPFIRKLMERQP